MEWRKRIGESYRNGWLKPSPRTERTIDKAAWTVRHPGQSTRRVTHSTRQYVTNKVKHTVVPPSTQELGEARREKRWAIAAKGMKAVKARPRRVKRDRPVNFGSGSFNKAPAGGHTKAAHRADKSLSKTDKIFRRFI